MLRFLPEDQETWLKGVLQHIKDMVRYQFIKGYQTHDGGDLRRKACYPRLRLELIDALVYYYVHGHRLRCWLNDLNTIIATTDTGQRMLTKVRKEIDLELQTIESDQEVFSHR